MLKILNIITNPNPILRKKSTKININKINSKEMKEFCQKRNVKILLVFIPHKSQVHPNILKQTPYSYYFDGLVPCHD